MRHNRSFSLGTLRVGPLKGLVTTAVAEAMWHKLYEKMLESFLIALRAEPGQEPQNELLRLC